LFDSVTNKMQVKPPRQGSNPTFSYTLTWTLDFKVFNICRIPKIAVVDLVKTI
jgi:hypothetical protein